MKYIFPFQLMDGHIIIETSENKYLIDTGAPSSVSSSNKLCLADNDYQTQSNYLGASPELLSTHIGTKIDGLVGTDILNKFDIIIDPTKSVLVLDSTNASIADHQVCLDIFMGIPIFEVSIDGKQIRVFFDTGAKLSYLSPDIASSYPELEESEDFYPGVGKFSTKTFEVPCSIGTENIMLKVGILPKLLQATLMMANTSGIVGISILDYFRVVYSPRRKTLGFDRLNMEPEK